MSLHVVCPRCKMTADCSGPEPWCHHCHASAVRPCPPSPEREAHLLKRLEHYARQFVLCVDHCQWAGNVYGDIKAVLRELDEARKGGGR